MVLQTASPVSVCTITPSPRMRERSVPVFVSGVGLGRSTLPIAVSTRFVQACC